MPSKLLYLDLNYWVRLSRARLQLPGDEQDRVAYEELRHAVANGRILIPLSTMLYMELARIKDPRQRGNLAVTMGELSQYASLTSRETLIADELRRSIARAFGLEYTAAPPSPIGYGFGHAFGKGTIVGHIRGDPAAIERMARERGDALIAKIEAHAGHGWRYAPRSPNLSPIDRVQDAFDQLSQFMILRGPGDDDLEALVGYGYRPEVAQQVTENIRAREEDLARILTEDPIWKQRLPDIVLARALFWDLNEGWNQAFIDVGLKPMDLDEIGHSRLNQVINGVPIVDVESAIRRRRFRNSSNKWEINDVHDIGFAGQVVVYCHAVLTDTALRHHVVSEHLDEKYGTEVLRGTAGLLEWLRLRKEAGDLSSEGVVAET